MRLRPDLGLPCGDGGGIDDDDDGIEDGGDGGGNPRKAFTNARGRRAAAARA